MGNKLHPLHTPEMISGWISSTGEYPDQTRRTGRSTAIALNTIADAMNKPFTWIQVKDHHDSVGADENLLALIMDIIDRIGLGHFYYKKDPMVEKFGVRTKYFIRFGE